MKRLLLLMLLLVTVFQGFSQTKGISYQAVILSPKAQEIPGANAQGNILANSAVSIQFTIVNASGTEEYQEQHSTRTDKYGMINLLIGTSSPTSGNDFSAIFWDGTTKKLKVGIDFSGGSNFSPLSEQNLSYMPQPATQETTQLIVDNSASIAAEKSRATVAEQSNTAAIALNTVKVGITAAQATTISNTAGINTGDQDISGITVNSAAISIEKTRATAAEQLNSAGIATEKTRAIQVEQDNATDISALKTEQSIQNNAIASNTTKVGVTPEQISTISNTTGINTGDQDISEIAINATAISTIQNEQITQNSAIALNTVKTGISAQQASDITTNNAKVSYPGAQDLSSYATKDMANGNITNLADPIDKRDAVTKEYVDNLLIKLIDLDKLLDAGFTVKQLLDGGTSVSDLKNAGVSLISLVQGGARVSDLLGEFDFMQLLRAGVTYPDLVLNGVRVRDLLDNDLYGNYDVMARKTLVSDLLAAGVSEEDLINAGLTSDETIHLSIQKRLLNGETPSKIYLEDNSLLPFIYGQSYAGGYIVYLEAEDNELSTGGYVVSEFQITDRRPTCLTQNTSKAEVERAYEDDNGEDILVLTNILANTCPGEINYATICRDLELGGKDDWAVPEISVQLKINKNYFLNLKVTDIINSEIVYVWNSSMILPYRNESIEFDFYSVSLSRDGVGFWPTRRF